MAFAKIGPKGKPIETPSICLYKMSKMKDDSDVPSFKM